MKHKLIAIFTIAISLASCSNNQVYNAIQVNRQQECQKLPPIQFDECMKEYSEPFESYQENREEILSEK